MTYHYVWLIWSSAFLLPWVLLFALFPQHRAAMWWASVFMAPFGLTEPIFVPEYWNPPSLFELAQRTGFDIESIIFSFAIGGIGAILYNIILHKRVEAISLTERHQRRHLNSDDLAWAYSRRGQADILLHQPARAIQDFDEEIRLTPNDADGFMMRAIVEKHLGDSAGAKADLAKACALDPKRSCGI